MDTARSPNSTITNRLAAIGGSAAFGYITIVLLQLKAIWGVWQWRDLTAGDTSSYFTNAYRWYSTGHGNFIWSPLYTWYYGLLLHVSRDAFIVTTWHRVIIVFVLALLVLALMRRLLPPGSAWLAAAWWVAMPMNFNSLYEVHMFSVIPQVLAALAVLWIPGRWGRGTCFAILLIESILVRNEFLLATILFGAGCVAWEYWRAPKDESVGAASARAYGVPLAAACLVILIFFARRTPENLTAVLEAKHAISVCQPYAFGYQQRHSDWQKSPWTECRDLMLRDFGRERPSLMEAFRANPPAVIEHFAWNLSLTPSGLQALLLNMMSGSVDPDYAFVLRFPLIAWPASLLILAVVLSGGYFLYRDWNHWWNALLKDRAWAWFAMICIACVTPMIILTQRPRPSYLLAFGIFLRAAIAVCTLALLRRGPRFQWAPALVPIAVVLLIALEPSYYVFRHTPRPLRDRYEALAPFRQWFYAPDTIFATASWPDELRYYIAPGSDRRDFFFSDLQHQFTPQKSLNQVLEQHRVSLVFADDAMLADPAVRGFGAEATSNGWRLVASSHDPAWPWVLWAKPDNVNAASVKK